MDELDELDAALPPPEAPPLPDLSVLQCCKCRSIVGDTSALFRVHDALGLIWLTGAGGRRQC